MSMVQSALMLAAVVIGPAGHADDEAKAEVDRLQGHWKVVALESEGRKATEAELEAMKDGGWTFEGDEVVFQAPRTPPVKSSFTIDPGTSPRSFDLVALDGPEKGKRMLGIYTWEDDRLTICLRTPGPDERQRPSSFEMKDAKGLALIVFERANR
jgi:uncharacterized protein (TIGR03067 family)